MEFRINPIVKLPKSTFVIYSMLRSAAGDSGQVKVSRNDIAKALNVSTRTVSRAYELLIANNYLEVVGGRAGKVPTYKVK